MATLQSLPSWAAALLEAVAVGLGAVLTAWGSGLSDPASLPGVFLAAAAGKYLPRQMIHKS